MKKKSVDRIIGLSAILISLLTLIMFIYQTRLMHEQSRLSVLPRLGFISSTALIDSMVTYTLELENNGIGPAIINSAQIISNGKVSDLDMEVFFENNYQSLNSLGSFESMSSLIEGGTLRPSSSKTIFSYKFNTKNQFKIRE